MLYCLMSFLRERQRPSLGDLLLAAMGAQLFRFPESWPALLTGGDTRWHLRAGEWTFQNQPLPTTDLFTFARAGLAVLAGCAILCTVMVLFQHMVWRRANLLIAFGVLLLAGRSLPSLQPGTSSSKACRRGAVDSTGAEPLGEAW